MRDYDIRQLLKRTSLSEYDNDPESKIVEELSLWATGSRIDIAVINGHLHGFEIKSAIDTLQRLPHQIEAYAKVFDYITVVIEPKHYGKVYDLLPRWVGISVCSQAIKEGSIDVIRLPDLNTAQDGFYIAKLLWRDELIDILKENNIPFKKSQRNWLLCEILSERIETPTLSTIVRQKLKLRKNWKEITPNCESD